MKYKAQQKQAEEETQRKINFHKNEAFIRSTQTRHNPIPDMRSAYQAVVNKNHQPTEEEIYYRRFTSSRYIDCK